MSEECPASEFFGNDRLVQAVTNKLPFKDVVSLMLTNRKLLYFCTARVWSTTKYWPNFAALEGCPCDDRKARYSGLVKRLSIANNYRPKVDCVLPQMQILKIKSIQPDLQRLVNTYAPQMLVTEMDSFGNVSRYIDLVCAAVESNAITVLDARYPLMEDLVDSRREQFVNHPLPNVLELLAKNTSIRKCRVPCIDNHYLRDVLHETRDYKLFFDKIWPTTFINTSLEELTLTLTSFYTYIDATWITAFRSLRRLTIDCNCCIKTCNTFPLNEALASGFLLQQSLLVNPNSKLDNLEELHVDGYCGVDIMWFVNYAPNLKKLCRTGRRHVSLGDNWSVTRLQHTRRVFTHPKDIYGTVPKGVVWPSWQIKTLCVDADLWGDIPLTLPFSVSYVHADDLPNLERVEVMALMRHAHCGDYSGFEMLDVDGTAVKPLAVSLNQRRRGPCRKYPKLNYLGPNVRIEPYVCRDRELNEFDPETYPKSCYPGDDCLCEFIKQTMPLLDSKRLCGHCIDERGYQMYAPDELWHKTLRDMQNSLMCRGSPN